jgi:hypothetical protein
VVIPSAVDFWRVDVDKLMAFLHKVIGPITKLGGGVGGTIPEWVPLLGGKDWKLWPFVAMAIFVSILLIYHFGFAT